MTHVREAVAEDAAAIAGVALEVHAIHAAALPDIFQPATPAVVSAPDIASLISQPGQLVFAAIADEKVVGYAHAEIQDVEATSYRRAAGKLHVHGMGVTASWRGRGVGSALIAAIREAAVARGLTGLTLDVYTFNVGARAFYEREGFIPLRERLAMTFARDAALSGES